jgi:hypothetical protein
LNVRSSAASLTSALGAHPIAGPRPGTIRVIIDFALMRETIPVLVLIERSLEITWDYLERTGELEDAAVASRVLLHSSNDGLWRGEANIDVSNKAVIEYRKFLVEREVA